MIEEPFTYCLSSSIAHRHVYDPLGLHLHFLTFHSRLPFYSSASGEMHFSKPNGEPYLTCHSIFKLRSRHNKTLYSKIADYIQNHLPIRLLQLSDMTLVDRTVLQEQMNEKIVKESLFCKETRCVCVEKVKDELKYSILSHRWGPQELTFSEFGKFHMQAIQSGPSSSHGMIAKMKQLLETTPFQPSFDKLLHFREVSTQRKFKYAWVDTICINKESSTELDESIRSMYAWYRDSDVCIVHLSQTKHSYDMEDDPWFTRGWTLQELLAPRKIKFFSSYWQEITRRQNDKDLNSMEQQAAKNGRDRPPLWSTIKQITQIPIEDLLSFKPGLYDIGKRMGWASKRQTTRVEDMAYCLIGIFRVNLSVAYGEKEGAFYRLQAAIMQNSDDPSLFNWRGSSSPYNSMFAASPQCFYRDFGFPSNNKPPTLVDRHSALATNFGQHVTRVLYHESEVPELEIWKDSDASAFIILTRSSTPKEYILMLLRARRIGPPQEYKRLDIIKTGFEKPLPEKSPIEILIK